MHDYNDACLQSITLNQAMQADENINTLDWWREVDTDHRTRNDDTTHYYLHQSLLDSLALQGNFAQRLLSGELAALTTIKLLDFIMQEHTQNTTAHVPTQQPIQHVKVTGKFTPEGQPSRYVMTKYMNRTSAYHRVLEFEKDIQRE